MEPPLAAANAVAYPDSLNSSPRSRNNDSWDESQYPSIHGGGATATALTKLRLMCSYGGHIVPRPHDKCLCYVGGDTRIVVVDRHTSLSDLTHRLSKTLLHDNNNRSSFTVKYQLPNEDLDSLISVTTDEDLENMIDEYERLNSTIATANKSSRLRLFLFPTKPESGSSIGSLLENPTKSEDWFLNALNGTTSGFSDTSSVNCLLGLDDDVSIGAGKVKDVEANIKGLNGGSSSSRNFGQDVHSVPDSPMLETTSSFGSASSSPSLANLPPIRVHAEDQKLGIEEQFSQMSVVQQKQQDDHGSFASSNPTTVPPVTVVTGVPMSSPAVITEYSNQVFSDDEKSERGLQMGGYQKSPQQYQQQRQTMGLDLASSDSVSSDGSITNPLPRHKPPMIYQDPIVQIPSSNNRDSVNPVDQNIRDPNPRIQIQQQQQQQQQQQHHRQIQDSGYLLSNQFDPQHQQLQNHPQQFFQSAPQYIHHHPSGAVPMTSYCQMYPSQQQQQQNFVYYMPARQAQGYNLPLQQPSYGDSSPAAPPTLNQTPPPSSGVYTTTRNAPNPKSDVYRTATSAAPQLVQPQYVGYSPSATSNYGYEFADSTQGGNIYYAQPMPPQSAAQYQTMTSPLTEAGSHLQVNNNMNQ